MHDLCEVGWWQELNQTGCCGPRLLIRWRYNQVGDRQAVNSDQRGWKFVLNVQTFCQRHSAHLPLLPSCSKNEKKRVSHCPKGKRPYWKSQHHNTEALPKQQANIWMFFFFFYETYRGPGLNCWAVASCSAAPFWSGLLLADISMQLSN